MKGDSAHGATCTGAVSGDRQAKKPYVMMILDRWGFYARLCDGIRPRNQTTTQAMSQERESSAGVGSDGLIK